MADAMSSSDDGDSDGKKCIIHVSNGRSTVSSFSEKSWTKFIACAGRWKNAGESEIEEIVKKAEENIGMPIALVEGDVPESLSKDALHLHVKRANYRAAIYKRALDARPEVPSPHRRGWKVIGDDISIHWMDLPPAPDSVVEFAHCSCKKSQCTKGKCSCLEKKLPCTDWCKCTNCENIPGEEQRTSPESNDSDIED
ncbi:uncharacterized protein LOC119741635 [Patiria miniata]|uniref:CRC domain-containing protein n=1 Tax=Patiria miniata TaxID=46514 RepID=A0A914BBH2_PATMI|nr:uncharacterized protein LOC119741635 [Patiria miniata]